MSRPLLRGHSWSQDLPCGLLLRGWLTGQQLLLQELKAGKLHAGPGPGAAQVVPSERPAPGSTGWGPHQPGPLFQAVCKSWVHVHTHSSTWSLRTVSVNPERGLALPYPHSPTRLPMAGGALPQLQVTFTKGPIRPQSQPLPLLGPELDSSVHLPAPAPLSEQPLSLLSLWIRSLLTVISNYRIQLTSLSLLASLQLHLTFRDNGYISAL